MINERIAQPNTGFASTARTILDRALWPGSPIELWIVTILVGTRRRAASHTMKPLEELRLDVDHVVPLVAQHLGEAHREPR